MFMRAHGLFEKNSIIHAGGTGVVGSIALLTLVLVMLLSLHAIMSVGRLRWMKTRLFVVAVVDTIGRDSRKGSTKSASSRVNELCWACAETMMGFAPKAETVFGAARNETDLRLHLPTGLGAMGMGSIHQNRDRPS